MAQDLTKMLDDVATWAKDRITVYAAASQSTLTKVVDGEYSGDELSADLTAAATRLADDLSSLLKLIPGLGTTPDPNNPVPPTP